MNTRGNNSTYMILNTLSKGDSRDIYPFLGTTTYGTNVPTSITTTATRSSNVNRFNLAKMNDWDEVIQYAEQRGVVPYLVFNDDSAYHAYNNEIYYRYLVGRLGYHVAVIWNLGEESNEIHGDIQRNPLLDNANLWDANRHILTVHLKACYSGLTQAPCVGGNGTTYTNSQGEVTADSASGPITTFSSTAYPDAATDLRRKLHPLIKNTRPDAYSYQVNEGGQNFMSAAVIKPNLFQLMIDNRAYMDANSIIRPIMIDELPAISTVADAGSKDAQFRLRRDYYYPTYIGGGNYEFHYGFNPVFPAHVATIQTQVGYARKLMDTILSAHFVNMTPMLSSNVITAPGSGKAVCAERLSNAFVCYLERGFASNPSLNLSAHASTKTFAVRWYNPRSGAGGLKGSVTSVTGGGTRSLGNPPSAACAADTSTNFDRDCVVYGI